MAHKLRVSCVSVGKYSHNGEEYEIEDGHMVVDDYETAHEIVRTESIMNWVGEAPSRAREPPGFNAEDFTDRYPMSPVVEDIESGDYDEHLDAIKEAELANRDRTGVLDAIEKREGE